MAIRPPLTNLVTGKPIRSNIPLNVNRKASRRGVQQSAVETYGEFTNLKILRNSPPLDEMGRNANKIQRKLQSGQKIDLEI